MCFFGGDLDDAVGKGWVVDPGLDRGREMLQTFQPMERGIRLDGDDLDFGIVFAQIV